MRPRFLSALGISSALSGMFFSLCCQSTCADAYSDQGMRLYQQGDYVNAGRYFAQSLQKQPNNPPAVFYSAMCIKRLGNTEAARNGFYSVIQVFPNSPEAKLAREQLGLPATARSTVKTYAPMKKSTPASKTPASMVRAGTAAGSSTTSTSGTGSTSTSGTPATESSPASTAAPASGTGSANAGTSSGNAGATPAQPQ
jgi:hypothetical protein